MRGIYIKDVITNILIFYNSEEKLLITFWPIITILKKWLLKSEYLQKKIHIFFIRIMGLGKRQAKDARNIINAYIKKR